MTPDPRWDTDTVGHGVASGEPFAGPVDALAELIGGRATPGIGFGIGLDRTILAMEEQGVELPAGHPLMAVVGASADDHADRLRVAATLRDAGLAVRTDGSTRKLGKQLEAASKAGARWAVIVGDELREGRVGLKDLDSGDQEATALEEVAGCRSRTKTRP